MAIKFSFFLEKLRRDNGLFLFDCEVQKIYDKDLLSFLSCPMTSLPYPVYVNFKEYRPDMTMTSSVITGS